MGTLQLRSSLGKSLRRFHDDEGGMEAIEAVVTLAISAVVLCGIFFLWEKADIGGEDGLLGAICGFLDTLFQAGKGVIGRLLN